MKDKKEISTKKQEQKKKATNQNQKNKKPKKRGRPFASKSESLCKKCDFVGRRPSDLKLHIIAKHSPSRFICTKCLKTYKYKCNLKKHQKNC